MTGNALRNLTLAGVVALGGGAVASVAMAQERVAADTAWSVFVAESPNECWAVSAPRETVNTRGGNPVQVRRGDILLFATYRAGSSVPEISFTGGYPFSSDPISLTIGTTEFQMVPDGEWAWAPSPEEDRRIFDAMRAGAEAVVQARSTRGTTTRDTFSLFGFTATTDEARNRCAQ